MKIRASIGVVALATALPAATILAAPADANCAVLNSSLDFTKVPVLNHYRVYTSKETGDSAIEKTAFKGDQVLLTKTGTMLSIYKLGKMGGKDVNIVVGPPNLELPLKPSPYRESFLMLQGSVTMVLADGTKIELRPGDMTSMEDTDARIGHGGKMGPCGYVALNVVP